MSCPPSQEGQEARGNRPLRWYPAWVAMLGMPVWVADPHGDICYLNRRAEVLVGKSASDAIGRPCHEIVSGRSEQGEPFCGPNCPVRFLVSRGRELAPYSLHVSNATGEAHELRVVVIAAHHISHDPPHLVHCVVDEHREDRMRRYLDRIASRTHTVPASPDSLEEFHLTGRERQILQMLADDKSLHDIAEELFLSYATVRNHVQHILRKLGVHSILEAVAFYLLIED